MTERKQVKRSLEALEPRGTQIVLADLLRWRLAAAHIPLENRRNSSSLAGGRRSNLRGRGIDFDEVRLYQAGDDVRAIDWRVTARTGKPHTKIFREEKERPVLLMIDLRSAMFFGSRRCFKSVLTAHAAALLAWATLNAGDRIGALLISDNGIIDIKPQRSRHTVLQLLRAMMDASVHHTRTKKTSSTNALPLDDNLTLDPPTLADAMRQIQAVSRPGSCFILLSDFHDWNDNCAQSLHAVVRHSQCFALQVDDALEQQLPAVGVVKLRWGFRNATIDTQDRLLQHRFNEQQQKQREQLADSLKKLHIPHITLQTGNDIFPALRQFFTGGKRAR
jgi:uncharacterized protein (DUF58 family)